MNSQQLKYARERAARIFSRGKEKIFNVHRGLSKEQRLAAIEAGKFSVSRSSALNWWHDIVFDEPKDDTSEKLAALQKDYDALLDKLVLGDSSEALTLLEAFEGKI